MKKFIAIILLLCMLFSVFTGCENNSDNAIIYYELSEMPQTVDPQLAHSNSELIISRNIYEGLMREDVDGKIVKGAAKEYSVSENIYTFILRDDIKWSDGKPLTAYDFVFGFRRGVDPINNTPYAEKLYFIKNAKNIRSASAALSSLGVSALNDYTLKIEVNKGENSDEILKSLTLPISMPCREDFFNECNGRYGMSSDTTLSNGSYRLRLWDTDNNKLRIWTNPYYNGEHIAKNSAVIFTYDTDKAAISRLEDENVDIAQIQTADILKAEELGLNIAQFENITWLLVMNDKKYSSALRQAFAASFNTDKYSSSLIEGYNISRDIFPEEVKKGEALSPATEITVSPQTLYKNAVAGLKNQNPGIIEIVYYNDEVMYEALIDIVGNWQKQFGVTVNLVPSKDLSVLQSQIKTPTYDMCLVPLISYDGDTENYFKYFGVPKSDLQKTQNTLIESYKIIPVAAQNTCFAYTSNLTQINISLKAGITDFAYVVKKD